MKTAVIPSATIEDIDGKCNFDIGEIIIVDAKSGDRSVYERRVVRNSI